jgi:hypothetical protein
MNTRHVCCSILFTGLIDKATDVSTHEQISASARFVECTGRKVTLRDEFLGFEGKRNYLGIVPTYRLLLKFIHFLKE